MTITCDVYWGSHGCHLPKHHDEEIPHECDCCECENHPDQNSDSICVAKPPYYGEKTQFYGEDVEYYGLGVFCKNCGKQIMFRTLDKCWIHVGWKTEGCFPEPKEVSADGQAEEQQGS